MLCGGTCFQLQSYTNTLVPTPPNPFMRRFSGGSIEQVRASGQYSRQSQFGQLVQPPPTGRMSQQATFGRMSQQATFGRMSQQAAFGDMSQQPPLEEMAQQPQFGNQSQPYAESAFYGGVRRESKRIKTPAPLISCEREVLVPRPAHLIYRRKIIYDNKIVTIPVVQQTEKKLIIPKPIQFVRRVRVPIVVWTTYPVRTAKVVPEEQIIKQPYITYQRRMLRIPRLLLIPRLCTPKPIRICIPKDCLRNYSVGFPNSLNLHSSNEDAYRTRGGYSGRSYPLPPSRPVSMYKFNQPRSFVSPSNKFFPRYSVNNYTLPRTSYF